jgi:hypothetical protein
MSAMKQIMTPVSPGELLDKMTILRIKRQRFASGEKRDHVLHELALLEQVWRESALETPEIVQLVASLQEVNEQLWVIEDDIRDKERKQSFGAEFIALARSVYQRNDHRAALKKQINLALGSDLVEEKSYQAY